MEVQTDQTNTSNEKAKAILFSAGVPLNKNDFGSNDHYLSKLEQMLEIRSPPTKIIDLNEDFVHLTRSAWTKDISDDDGLLEEYGPFNLTFYYHLNSFLCHAFLSQSLQLSSQKSATQTSFTKHEKNEQKKSMMNFHLRCDIRGVRILLALLNMPSHIFDKSLLFVDKNIHANSDSKETSSANKSKTDFSLLDAITKHISKLPSLEAQLRSLQRELLPQRTNATANTNALNKTQVSGLPSNSSSQSSSTHERMEHMKKMTNISSILDEVLRQHVSSLELILGDLYENDFFNENHCDELLVSTRSFIRSRIGSILSGFSLNSSSGTVSQGMMTAGIENTSSCGIDMVLWTLHRIISGFSPPPHFENGEAQENVFDQKTNNVHKHLVENILLPLHYTHAMVLWRDQTPLLSLYHKPLVLCLVELCNQSTAHNIDLLNTIIQGLLHSQIWPITSSSSLSNKGACGGGGIAANTPKVILILHEIDTLLEKVLGKVLSKSSRKRDSEIESKDDSADENILKKCNFFIPLTFRLCELIKGDNFRTSERALEFFKESNNTFSRLFRFYISKCIQPVMKALCRVDSNMEIAWNPTVNKMTKTVLSTIEEWDPVLFESTANALFGNATKNHEVKAVVEKDLSNNAKGKEQGIGVSPTIPRQQRDMKLPKSFGLGPTRDMISIKGAMKDWKPPSSSSFSNSSRHEFPPPSSKRQNRTMSSAPPLTITGVAPWAIQKNINPKHGAFRARKEGNTFKLPQPIPTSSNRIRNAMSHPGIVQEEKGEETKNNTLVKTALGNENGTSSNTSTGLEVIYAFKSKLVPKTDGDDEDEGENKKDGISSWARDQLEESPILLPSLKFHDLVFGHELGNGAFSSVVYARRIIKRKTKSHWPEFAVKIVKMSKIIELGYSASINREISILSLLSSHPNISRLVSSFRFRDGAYLVLEYASKGDLHSILQNQCEGSLDHESCVFVIGEIVAGLCSIHESGFVYGDLKPENILLTETGHVKVTDFGACRPYTNDAKSRLKKMKNVWKELRNGDWREEVTTEKKEMDFDCDEEDENGAKQSMAEGDDEEEDTRIEGTTAYIPPEVALGSIPTPAADSWALGCVLYQCLSGRPPLLEESEEETMQRIVTFELQNEYDTFFGENDKNKGKIFKPQSKDLILSLLSRYPQDRPDMRTISVHEFFNGTNVFSLYKTKAPTLSVGNSAPTTKGSFQRRQFSSIWDPRPQAYGLDDKKDASQSKNVGSIGSTLKLCLSNVDDMRKKPIVEGKEKLTFFNSRKKMKLESFRES